MEIIARFPEYKFRPDKIFSWDPASRMITYDPKRIISDPGKLSLLHELGHALLGHTRSDVETHTYMIERDAWDVARLLAEKFHLKIDHGYVGRQLKRLGQLGY